MHNLFSHAKLVELSSGVAASDTSTDHYFDGVDMRGYDGVAFGVHIVSTGTSTSLLADLSAQMCASSSGDATWTNCYGSTASWSTGMQADTGFLITDVFKVSKRYARPYLDRKTTGEAVLSAFALLYRARLEPTSPSTGEGVPDIAIVVATSS